MKEKIEIPSNNKKRKISKMIFLLLGFICLFLAYLGVALPGFPGTPFIILTAFFFIRSSDRLYNWMLKTKIFGKIIREFNEGDRISLKFKLFVILQFWITIIVASSIFVKDFSWRVVLVCAGIIFSIGVLMLKKSKNKKLNS